MDEHIHDRPKADTVSSNFVDRHEKNILVGLVVFTVGILFLGFFQIFYSLSYPIAKSKAEGRANAESYAQQQADLFLPDEASIESDLALKAKDTDYDGLNDFDEMRIYNTSPYLEDSDSDGLDDKKEVQSGSDPNCPVGKNCQSSFVADEGISDEVASAQMQDILNGVLEVDEIRSYLKQSGVPADEVDNLSDEQIQLLYEETLEVIGQGE